MLSEKIYGQAPVEISARHVHLSEKDAKQLFGDEARLIAIRPISQPGQFLSEQRVILAGPKGEMSRVAILGPTRKQTQVELTFTECRQLGVNSPIRESGDLSDSGQIKIVGPAGEITLDEGLIVIQRHLHLTPEDAERFGLSDGQIVAARCGIKPRRLIFEDVLTRVSPTAKTALHLDTDESNSAGILAEGEMAEIIDSSRE